jgi:anti-sigma regulatory factor (Ser/Thr protein kinase)
MNRQSWRLPATARSVPEARHHVVGALQEWGYDGLVETARLLTSELVTNAVLHARTEMVVTVEDSEVGVRISVADSSPVPPSLRHHSTTATTGRGLRLLDQLARDWSVDDDNGGKTVWFTLADDVDPWSAYAADTWLAEADA